MPQPDRPLVWRRRTLACLAAGAILTIATASGAPARPGTGRPDPRDAAFLAHPDVRSGALAFGRHAFRWSVPVRASFGTGSFAASGTFRVSAGARTLREGAFSLAVDAATVGGTIALADGRRFLVRGDVDRAEIIPRPAAAASPQTGVPGAPGPEEAFPALPRRRDARRVVRSVVFLATPEALLAAGGTLSDVEQGIHAALGPANARLFAESGTVFVTAGAIPIPYSDARRDVRTLFEHLEGGGPPARLAAAAQRATGADHVCLLVGPGGYGSDHGYAAIGRDVDTPAHLSVVRVRELRAGDATLVHELCHNLGWRH